MNYSSRQKAIWLGVSLLLLASVVVVGVVAGGGEGNGSSGASSADGVLVRVGEDRLTLRLPQPVEGQSEIDFEVRPEDRKALDLPHLELHATDGLPTRIHYDRDGDRNLARSAEDLPSPRQ